MVGAAALQWILPILISMVGGGPLDRILKTVLGNPELDFEKEKLGVEREQQNLARGAMTSLNMAEDRRVRDLSLASYQKGAIQQEGDIISGLTTPVTKYGGNAMQGSTLTLPDLLGIKL